MLCLIGVLILGGVFFAACTEDGGEGGGEDVQVDTSPLVIGVLMALPSRESLSFQELEWAVEKVNDNGDRHHGKAA